MGYSTKPGKFGGTIKSYWPDDTPDVMYITSDSQHSLAAIIDMCKTKWPDADFNDLVFESGEIQTNCLGYDIYDPSDYTDFIIISRTAK